MREAILNLLLPKETDIGQPLQDHLEGRGWDGYGEVIVADGRKCDLALLPRDDSRPANVKADKLWAIECKLGATQVVLSQAKRWIRSKEGTRQAELVSIGTAEPQRRNEEFELQCEDFGIGLFYININTGIIEEILAPVYKPRNDDMLFEALRPGQRGFALPCSNGKRFTEKNATIQRVFEYAKEHPGCLMKEAFDAADDRHYNERKIGIRDLLRLTKKNKIPGLKYRGSGLYVE